MRADDEDLPPGKPKHPCVVCGVPTDVQPICDRWQLCLPHVADWFEDKRFGSDFEKNIAATPGWIADMKRKAVAA